ncbi:uncharacterized protein K460DRAFT_127029 [Cucurbitaria berberidis CBS 394.84]|uniref:Calcium channel YVC1-like C-terminal transmembrane domain-containing protein n=1 Tax=Cucurbitaria berberidis CBS 394.84 TaxID=1168544 RepID=A0A9P4GJ93_9PLEO|nr:uncharacterized protein K460DRAFT_127029 [Cucurbitaria berberidis CBS 394.84]KAF1846615.1 hypothetical protein K460DRAFT_127029 [Cucurbitaria berberidis CBS 394.84]
MSLPVTPKWPSDEIGVPKIIGDECFGDLVDKLSQCFEHTIRLPHTFEDLRRSQEGRALQPLIAYLSSEVHHPALVSALLALKGHFSALEEASDEPGVNEGRGYACEFVAWQFVGNLTDRDIIDFLLVELPSVTTPSSQDAEAGYTTRETGRTVTQTDEQTPLLSPANSDYFGYGNETAADARFRSLTTQCENLSALEIASVSGAKKFLGQRPVQKIINGLWRGDIVFWETLSVNSVKKPQKYNRRLTDPFSRLRVPLYLKVFETLFFAVFLALYYTVLVHRDFTRVTTAEIFLYVWIASFAYDEFAGWVDAGQTSFYASDFWWMWDISIVVVGMIFCILRIVGLTTSSADTIDLAYDVLGLEALFLVPRIFALLSLNRYFGTLIPCLKEMTKDFVKFLSLVVILYLGFLTTFVLLARDKFKPKEMSWILIKVFFGSSYLGFDIAKEISPFFGPPVMLLFVSLTNILLITSLISLLSNSLSKILDHARDEYLFIYSVYVLEASSSNRLTYFLPPFVSSPFAAIFVEWRRALSAGPSNWPADIASSDSEKCSQSQPLKTLRYESSSRGCRCHSTSSKPCSAAQALSIAEMLPGTWVPNRNLIPLCLRPFRLIVPSERLRSARIVLLKATHVPFVGAIWAYEQLAQAHDCQKDTMFFSGPRTPVPRKKLPRLPINSPRLLMADAQAAPNTPGRGQHASWPHTTAGLTESDAQLKTLVLKLMTQVEELTAMVSQLQEQREASTAA